MSDVIIAGIVAQGGGGSSSSGVYAGTVHKDGAFPTTRLDGTALDDGDYVKPTGSASDFPFTIAGVTFNNTSDKAIYVKRTTSWILDPGAIQETAEIPVSYPANESISGTATTQSSVNIENKTEILKRVEKSTDTTSDLAYTRTTGVEGTTVISKNADADTLAKRDTNGVLKVGTPTNNSDATTKLYVDNKDIDSSTSTFTKDLTGTTDKLNITLKDKNGTELLNKDVNFEDKIVLETKTQTLKNKTIEAKDNHLDPIIESTTFPASSAEKSLYYNTTDDEVKFTRDGGTTWHDLGGKAIIDVTVLPTTGIKQNVYYRTVTEINPTIEGYYTLTTEKSSIYSIGSGGIYESLPSTVYTTWEQVSNDWDTYSSWFDRSSTVPEEVSVYATRYTFDGINYSIIYYLNVPKFNNVVVQFYKNSKWYEVVNTESLQTLKYKVIDSDINAISNLTVDSLKTGVLDTSTLTTTDDNHVASSKLIYNSIIDSKRGFAFTGYVSSTEPTGTTIREDELWYETTDIEMPTVFPIQVHRYSSGAWSITTENYTPKSLDLWANKNNDHGYYYFGNSWNLLDFNVGVDNTTINYNLADQLQVKDLGITKVKLNTALFSNILDTTSTDNTIATSKTIYDNLKTYAKALDTNTSNKKIDLKDADGNVLDTVISTEISDITKDDTVTLTNKTVNADNNIISNLEVDNLKAGVLDTSTLTITDDTHVASSKLIQTKLDGKIDHYEVMPTASVDYNNQIAQYIGTTTTTAPIYINGYFYKCQEVTPATTPVTYEWVIKQVQNPLVDNTTIDLTSDDKLEVKDGSSTTGITVAKMNTTAVSTSINETSAVDTKLTTEKAVWDGLETRIRQYSIMPTATSENVDKIVQYIGTTTSTYTNGTFYKCEEDTSTSPATYEWVVLTIANNIKAETLEYRDNGITEPAVYTNVKTKIDSKQNTLTAGTGLALTNDNISINQIGSTIQNFTQIGGTLTADYLYTGADTSYLQSIETMPLSTAENWEFRTKYTYNGGGTFPTILGFSGNIDHKTPALVYEDNSVRFYLSNNGSSWNINGGGSLLVMTTNTTYYIKAGFDGTKYYLDYNTTGWDDTFTNALTVNNSTKVYCSVPFTLMNSGLNPSVYYSTGTMDLKETKLYVNGSIYWQHIINSSGVAKATTALYGLVKPDGTTITINDGVISSSGSSATVHFFDVLTAGNDLDTGLTLGNSILVFKNGVLLQSGAGNDYTISGSVITFATSLVVGDKITVINGSVAGIDLTNYVQKATEITDTTSTTKSFTSASKVALNTNYILGTLTALSFGADSVDDSQLETTFVFTTTSDTSNPFSLTNSAGLTFSGGTPTFENGAKYVMTIWHKMVFIFPKVV